MEIQTTEVEVGGVDFHCSGRGAAHGPVRSTGCGAPVSPSVSCCVVSFFSPFSLCCPDRAQSSSRSQLSSGITRDSHSVGFHNSTRSMTPCTKTSVSRCANVRRWSGNRHATLAIDLDLGRVRRPDSCSVAIRPSRFRSLLHHLHLPLELAGCPERQAPLGVLGEIAPSFELGAELRRQDDPALRVERVLVSPDESRCHQPSLPRHSLACACDALSLPFTPLYATSLHCTTTSLPLQPK